MRDSVKWRKQSRIVIYLAQHLNISPEKALGVFYGTNTYKLFADSKTGLELMSDAYIFEDLLAEINTK